MGTKHAGDYLKFIEAFRPHPMFSDKLSGIMVSIYKTDDDFYSELELDARMIKIIKHIQKSGLVSNKDVQAISGVSKATATRLL